MQSNRFPSCDWNRRPGRLCATGDSIKSVWTWSMEPYGLMWPRNWRPRLDYSRPRPRPRLLQIVLETETRSQWRRKQFASGGGGTMPKFFLMCTHFSLVPPHMRGHNDCLLPTDNWSVPSVGSALCTSTGEVGRGAIKVMGPVLCLADFSVTRNWPRCVEAVL